MILIYHAYYEFSLINMISAVEDCTMSISNEEVCFDNYIFPNGSSECFFYVGY